MSPAKKTTRKATAKKASARRKAASKKTKPPKARTKKKAGKKAIPAKTKKRIADASRAAKKEASTKATMAAKKTAERALEEKRAATQEAAQKKVAEKAPLPPPPRPPPPEAHPRLGVKHTCFQCSAKFYDLFRPEPLCPKCGADQREAPKAEAKHKLAFPVRRPGKRDMVPLLDDEDEEILFDEGDESGLDLEHAGAELDDPADDLEDDIDL